MGQFRSQLLRQLDDAADITYDPTKRLTDRVHRHGFTNEDAQRMDRMKTAIMRLLLRRAYNFMTATGQDSLPEEKRIALTEFSVELTTSNIHHKGQPIMTGIIPKSPNPSVLDWSDGRRDDGISWLLSNFVMDMQDQSGQVHSRLMLNCT